MTLKDALYYLYALRWRNIWWWTFSVRPFVRPLLTFYFPCYILSTVNTVINIIQTSWYMSHLLGVTVTFFPW